MGVVNAVSIDRQGLRCVTTSDDHTVRVWNLVSGCCEQVLQGHGVAAYGVVFDVAISADGSLAATVSEDFSCRVWDLDSEEGLHVLEGHSG
ncbi:WD_REPEATS_REGION domain-containing protein, partial [Haematococcus lacustris]